jgi:isopentenyl-diphosphate Delta-isomerase
MPTPSTDTLIDSVDSADRPIGVVARGDVFQEHAGFRVAHIFVFNMDGDLLLQQVGRERDRSPLLWGSSVASYLFAGETYAQAAERRLREELRLATPIRKVGSTRMDDSGSTKFIELYETISNDAEIGDRRHINDLQFVPLSIVAQLLALQPEIFTETFPHVFRLYSAIADLIDPSDEA